MEREMIKFLFKIERDKDWITERDKDSVRER